MTRTTRSRRRFLESLASVAVAGPILGRLSKAEEVFAQALDEVGQSDWSAQPEALRERYLLDSGVVYLNHASIGTMPQAVHEARTEYSAICESNPHLYIWGGAWNVLLDEVRTKAGRFLGASPDEVAITHNTTEGFNTLAQGLPLGPGDEVVFSSLNHPGASIPWEHAGAARGFSVRRFDFPVRDIPEMSADEVVEVHRLALSERTRVLVFPHVDNIVGLRHPLAEINRMAKAAGVEFVAVDGAQAVGMIPVDVAASGIDAYATSPHKWLQAPKGLGLFFVRAAVRDQVTPMWVRYGVQRWSGSGRIFEDYGTRNSPEVMALGDAMDFQDALGTSDKEMHYRRLWSGMKERVEATPGLRWNSPRSFERGSVLVSIGFDRTPATAAGRKLYLDDGIVLRAFETEELNAFRVSPNVATDRAEMDVLFARLEGFG
jgi:selenocysteine lyase/cysteine desulfurase